MTKDAYIARLEANLRAIDTIARQQEGELIGAKAALYHIRGQVRNAFDAKVDSDPAESIGKMW